MGKISPVSGKYIVHATIKIDGVVEKPDVIGAIFGQTEGLLGSELELRELQRSGRIGRIEVNTTTKGGKVEGEIIIPSSLDKAETAIIAAALEVIERIGPCNADIKVDNIQDIRITKRKQVIERAKQLLHDMIEQVMPDSTEIAEEVGESVRVMEVTVYGKDKLPAGPAVADSEEVIVVEGRADVLNLLKYGFKNAIATNGANVPQTIIDLSKQKNITVFVDGDRGGDLNIKELLSVAEIDFVVRAPDGKEVEELTQKEIHKALRGKMTPEQFTLEQGSREKNNFIKRNKAVSPTSSVSSTSNNNANPVRRDNRNDYQANKKFTRGNERRDDREDRTEKKFEYQKKELTDYERDAFFDSIQELLGTKGASLLDSNANVLGKVPIKELPKTLKSLKGSVYAIAIDGDADDELAKVCDETRVKFLVGMNTPANKSKVKVSIYSANDLERK